MPIPTPVTPAGAAGLAAILADPGRALLAFDFDGVIAPIVPDPQLSRPHPRILPALARLAPHVGAIAVVTGRPAAVAVDYGGFATAAGLDRLVVFGHYGRERWQAGAVSGPPPHPGVATARAELPGLLRTHGGPDAWVEDKGDAVAVHTRRCDDPQGTFDRLRGPARRARRPGRAGPGAGPARAGAAAGRGRQGHHPAGVRGARSARPPSPTPATTWATCPRSRRCRPCGRTAYPA